MKTKILLLALLICNACAPDKSLKQEILDAETEFNRAAQEIGIKEAFLAFAHDSAVLVRNNRVIKGKKEIEEYFNQQDFTDITLEWKPEFVDVSSSGDMGYTYGNYHLTFLDSLGKEEKLTGIFHTVWKKGQNGEWKYVYD